MRILRRILMTHSRLKTHSEIFEKCLDGDRFTLVVVQEET